MLRYFRQTRKTRIFIFGVIGLVLLLAIGGFVVANKLVSAAPSNDLTIKEWPAFTLVYELTQGGRNQVVRLEYQDARHWRVEVLQESAAPETAGAWAEYDGNEVRQFDPLTGNFSVNNDVPSDGVYVPEEWLAPYYIPKLLAQSNAQVAGAQKATSPR